MNHARKRKRRKAPSKRVANAVAKVAHDLTIVGRGRISGMVGGVIVGDYDAVLADMPDDVRQRYLKGDW